MHAAPWLQGDLRPARRKLHRGRALATRPAGLHPGLSCRACILHWASASSCATLRGYAKPKPRPEPAMSTTLSLKSTNATSCPREGTWCPPSSASSSRAPAVRKRIQDAAPAWRTSGPCLPWPPASPCRRTCRRPGTWRWLLAELALVPRAGFAAGVEYGGNDPGMARERIGAGFPQPGLAVLRDLPWVAAPCSCKTSAEEQHVRDDRGGRRPVLGVVRCSIGAAVLQSP